MKFNSNIHGYPHIIKTILGYIEFTFSKPKQNLFVLNYHGTPKKFISHFEKQLDFLQEYFEIISPTTFFDTYTNTTKNNKNQLLLTFDDGLKNNLYAVDVLNKRHLSALFFIVPDFIESSNHKSFYLKNIRPQINPLIDSEAEDFESLSWEDLQLIIKNHHIGSHSKSHIMTAGLTSLDALNKEIVESKKILETKLNITVNSFCSINNTLLSVNSESKKLIESNYYYHFTTLAGCNNTNRNPHFIKRINVECFWTISAIKFSIGKSNLNRWEGKIKEYNTL